MKPISEDTGSFLAIRTANPQMLYVDRPTAVAMDQATAKKYAEPYLAPSKPVWLVGLSFARDTRRFVEGAVLQMK